MLSPPRVYECIKSSWHVRRLIDGYLPFALGRATHVARTKSMCVANTERYRAAALRDYNFCIDLCEVCWLQPAPLAVQVFNDKPSVAVMRFVLTT
jgi:hypothetical protein